MAGWLTGCCGLLSESVIQTVGACWSVGAAGSVASCNTDVALASCRAVVLVGDVLVVVLVLVGAGQWAAVASFLPHVNLF